MADDLTEFAGRVVLVQLTPGSLTYLTLFVDTGGPIKHVQYCVMDDSRGTTWNGQRVADGRALLELFAGVAGGMVKVRGWEERDSYVPYCRAEFTTEPFPPVT